MFFTRSLTAHQKMETGLNFSVAFAAGYLNQATGSYTNAQGYPWSFNLVAAVSTATTAIKNAVAGQKAVAATETALVAAGFLLGSLAGSVHSCVMAPLVSSTPTP